MIGWKAAGSSRTHTLRRRIGRYQLRELLFQIEQFAQERIVLGIANLRIVQDVIAVISFGENLP